MTLPSAVASSLADQVAAVLEQMPDPSGGAATGQLEHELARAFGVPHAVAVASGTAALHAALSACGIGPGDEVLVPALTVVMTVAPVVALGATPVFVDSDPATLDLDYDDAARKITPQTQAILPVHLWGRMGDPAALSAFASGHGLTIIEDAAQAAGSSRSGRKAGTIGAAGCFSMKDGKILWSGEGGFLLTARRELAEHAAAFRSHWQQPPPGQAPQSRLGTNSRLAGPLAAIALANLRRFPELAHQRREQTRSLLDALEPVPWPARARTGTGRTVEPLRPAAAHRPAAPPGVRRAPRAAGRAELHRKFRAGALRHPAHVHPAGPVTVPRRRPDPRPHARRDPHRTRYRPGTRPLRRHHRQGSQHMGSVTSDQDRHGQPPQRPLRQYTPHLRTDFRMTIPPPRHPCTRGPLISTEGIPGVGKTYLTSHAVNGLDGKPLILDGFSQREQGSPDLGKALLRALRETSGPDPFLRGGAPAAEALLLLAIKRHDLDMVLPELSGGRIVVEGRSVDTTAVCQAVQLHPGAPAAALDEAVALVGLAASFRPLPDLTILITDDASAAIERAQRRDNRLFTPEPGRVHDVRHARSTSSSPPPIRHGTGSWTGAAPMSHEAVRQIRAWILQARHGLSCVREPWQSPGACCMYCGHRMEAAPE